MLNNTHTPMTAQPQPNTEPQPRRRADLQAVRIPYWLTEKAGDELTSWEQLAVYCWIFDHNGFALRQYGSIYGKHTYDTYHREITRDLNIRKPQPIVRKLIAAGWIAESWAAPFKGKTMKGYRCLLDSKQRMEQKAEQQELQLQDEQAVTVVESAVRVGRTVEEEGVQRPFDDGMYHLGRQHWYHIDPDGPDTEGNRQYVPEQFAFNRPSTAHIFDTEGQRWCLPGEETIPPMEY